MNFNSSLEIVLRNRGRVESLDRIILYYNFFFIAALSSRKFYLGRDSSYSPPLYAEAWDFGTTTAGTLAFPT